MADTLAFGASAPASLSHAAPTRWETRQAVRLGQAADIKIYPEGARASAGAIATVHVRCGREQQAEDLAQLIAAAPELLAELRAAYWVIRHARVLMTPEQMIQWGQLNAAVGAEAEGITRTVARGELLARLGGFAA